MYRTLGKLLICSTILVSSFSTINAFAETSIKEVTNIEMLDPIQKNLRLEKEASNLKGKRFYVDHQKISYFKDKETIVANKLLEQNLTLGTYYNILDSAMINGLPYLQVSVSTSEKDSVWIAYNDSLKLVTVQNQKKVKKYDSNKEYFIVNSETETYLDIPLNKKRQIASDSFISPNTKVNILEEYEVVKEKDVTLWYMVSYTQTFKTKEEAEKFTENIPFSFEEIEGKGFKVTVSGWVNQSYLKNISLPNESNQNIGTFELTKEIIAVKELPTNESQTIAMVSGKGAKERKIMDNHLEDLTNVIEKWYKIQEIDSNGNPIKNTTLKYVKEDVFTKFTYTKVEHKSEIPDQIIKTNKKIALLDKPKDSKNVKIIGSVEKDEYLFAFEQLDTDTSGIKNTWYRVKDGDGKELGLVSHDEVSFIEGNTVKYDVKKGDTLEKILKTFGITQDEFTKMNLLLIYGGEDAFKLSEGMSVVVKQPEINYDTSKVSGTESGVALVREMMPTARLILDAQIKPSVAYAQAILESGGGTSGLANTNNNLFGIKGTYRGNGSSWATLEDSGGGNMYSINATFRAYPNKMVSILDYVTLITESGIYDRAINLSTAYETAQAIKDSGYATDSSYVEKVMSIIDKYDLEQFDNV